MKTLSIIILFLFAASVGMSQGFPVIQKPSAPKIQQQNRGALGADSGYVQAKFPDTATANLGFLKGIAGFTIRVKDTLFMRSDDTTKWIAQTAGSGYVKIQTLPPLATLTGGSNRELTSAGTTGVTLNWGATRQAAGVNTFATANLSTITVAGFTETFANPAAGGTVSGTQGVTVTNNANTTYNNVVVTSDGKSVTASTSVNWYSTYYIGYSLSNTPTDANLIAAGYGFLNTAGNRVTNGILPSPAGSAYIVFAFPQSMGTATVTINGLGVGYTLIQRNVTNASGAIIPYNIYVSPFSTSGGVSYSIN